MKKLFCLLFLLFTMFNAKSQNSAWSLAPNYLDMNGFVTVAPLPQPIIPPGQSNFYYYHGQIAEHSHNAMQDEDGNLMFFIVDDMIYDKDGYLINQISDPNFLVEGVTETVIVPQPNTCGKFYIFLNGRQSYSQAGLKPFYAILDMSQPNIYSVNGPDYNPLLQFGNRDGILIEDQNSFTSVDLFANFNLPPSTSGQVFMAASKIRNDDTRFVFVSTHTKVWRFILSENDLIYDGNYLFAVGPLNQNNWTLHLTELAGEMELISLPNNNYRIAFPITLDENPGPPPGDLCFAVYIADLLADGTVISTSERIVACSPFIEIDPTNFRKISGLEFSPNGDNLFITRNEGNANPVEYYNYNTNQVVTFNVPFADNYATSQIEMGFNDKMYFANANNISFLSNPNNPILSNWNLGIGVNYTPTHLFGQFFESYSLPDQIDGMDYSSIGGSEIACCIGSSAFDADIYVAQPGSWIGTTNPINPGSNEVYIENELRIPAGTNLVIEDMIFYFAPDAKVVIEANSGFLPAGRLQLVNTTFTVDNHCDASFMWQGVELLGHSNLPQSGTNQGEFRMSQESILEHALTGVKVGTTLTNTGGIVGTENSTFRNNKQDVQMWPYSYTLFGNVYNNYSRFYNTNFIVDDQLNNGDLDLNNRVFLYGITSVSFRSCNFGIYGLGLNFYTHNNSGVGILSFLSNCSVYGQCPNYQYPIVCDEQDVTAHWIGTSQSEIIPSVFQNLRYGIYSLGIGMGSSTSIRQSLFDNNKSGIYLSGVNNATLFKNRFIIPIGIEEDFNYFYGAELLGCTDYTVERNYFTGIGFGKHAGIWLINSGPYANEIYLNDFDNLTIGTGVQKVNRDEVASDVGLEILCGFYDHNDFDIALTGGSDVSISKWQGNFTNPAGNIFDNDFSVGNSHLSDEGNLGFIYFHNEEALFNVEPDFFTSNVYPIELNIPFISRENTCPTLAQQSKSQFKNIVENKRLVINQMESDLQQLVDNGDTQAMVNLINSSTNNSSEIRIALLQASPFLSEEVLMAAINRIDPLNQWHLCEVLLANSPLSNQVMQAYDTQSPLSEFLDDLLLQYQDGTSSYHNQLSQINVERRQKEIALKGYVKEVFKDSIEVKVDDIKDIMIDEELNREIKAKVLLLNFQGNNAEAISLLDSYEESVNDRWKDVMEIYLSLDISNMFADVTSAQLDELNEIKLSENPGFIEAGNLLEIITGEKFEVELFYPDENKNAEPKTTKISKKRKPELVGVYPNPAKGEFYITYVLPTEKENASIDIYNLEGKLVKSEDITNGYGILQLDSRQFKPGMFIFNLQLNGETVATNKFTIVE